MAKNGYPEFEEFVNPGWVDAKGDNEYRAEIDRLIPDHYGGTFKQIGNRGGYGESQIFYRALRGIIVILLGLMRAVYELKQAQSGAEPIVVSPASPAKKTGAQKKQRKTHSRRVVPIRR